MTRYADADFKSDRSLLPFSSAKNFYNIDFSSGVLRKGYGVKAHSCVPTYAQRYWIYRLYSEEHNAYVDQYIYQYSNGLLAWHDAFKNKEIYVSGRPFKSLDIINYRVNSKDVLLLSCEGRKLMTWDGTALTEYDNSPGISSMAIHYERLFVTSRDERTKVYFSKNLDPTQWEISEDGGGFIELLDERGYLNKVVSFGNYLYIFRDHGISRVTAYGDQSEFSVVNMFVTAGRIFPSSITTCGNCIMFLASDGLYKFDGYNCVRTLTDISPSIQSDDNCACAYYDGKYYLACNVDFADGRLIGCESSATHKINALIVYDPLSGEYSISRGIDISFMNACSYNGEDFLMCCESGSGGIIERGASRFGKLLPSYWESGVTDMHMPDKIKYVTEILFDNSDGDSMDNAIVGVCADGEWHTLNIQSAITDGVKLNVSGRRFSFSLSTITPKLNITPLCVKYNTY